MFINDFSDRWNVIVPILFLIDRNPDFLENIDGIRCYLFRAMFFTYFQNGTTAKLSKLKTAITESEFTITEDLLEEQIPELAINEQKIEDIVNAEKGKLTNIVLTVLYADKRVYGKNYDQDHLHPKSHFDKEAPIGVSDEQWYDWHKNKCNRLPNLQLLDKLSNQFKSDLPLLDFYNSLPDNEQSKFCENSLIPNGTLLNCGILKNFMQKGNLCLKST